MCWDHTFFIIHIVQNIKYIDTYIFIYVFCVAYIISVIYNARGSTTVDTTHSSTVIT